MNQAKKSTNQNFFTRHKASLITGAVIMCVAIIGSIIAVNIINSNKEQARLQQEEEEKALTIANFKNAYFLSTGSYTEEQKTCVWNQIQSITNEAVILAAAEEYESGGNIVGDAAFANKVYASIGNIFTTCNVEQDAQAAVDKITDVIDITLTGTGTTSSDVITLKRGLVDITLTSAGDISFDLQNVNGNYVNCYGSFGSYTSTTQETYTKKCTLDYAGDYYFDVRNSATNGRVYDWTLNIRQE